MNKLLFKSHLHYLVKLFFKKQVAISAFYWQSSYSSTQRKTKNKRTPMPDQNFCCRQALAILLKLLSHRHSQHISNQRYWLLKDRASNSDHYSEPSHSSEKKIFGRKIQNIILTTSTLLWKSPPKGLFLVWGNYLRRSPMSFPHQLVRTQGVGGIAPAVEWCCSTSKKQEHVSHVEVTFTSIFAGPH